MGGDGTAHGDPAGSDADEPGERVLAATTVAWSPAPCLRPVALSSTSALTASAALRGSSPQAEVLRYVVSDANSLALTRSIAKSPCGTA